MDKTGNKVTKTLALIRERLPKGWALSWEEASASVVFRSPSGEHGALGCRYRERLEPREAEELISEPNRPASMLVVGRFLSKNTRERLVAAGLSHADQTGNLWLVLDSPGLFLSAPGAFADPERKARPARTLKGSRAGRIVRALCDHPTPVGVRELAAWAGCDAGYTSRVLSLLYKEALLERQGRGPITRVDLEGLLRRWSEDAPLASRSILKSYIEPRGLSALLERLGAFPHPYAITGSLAASRLAAVAAPRLAQVYVEDVEEAARSLALYPAEAGANVMLLQPNDPIAMERTQRIDELRFAAPSQVVADLLCSPGRGPAEAEALLSWMHEHPKRWRHA